MPAFLSNLLERRTNNDLAEVLYFILLTALENCDVHLFSICH